MNVLFSVSIGFAANFCPISCERVKYFIFLGQKLEQMMTELRSELASQPPLPGSYNPRKGELCAAKFSDDGQWYRARIENAKSRDAVDVLYIDFGNVTKK